MNSFKELDLEFGATGNKLVSNGRLLSIIILLVMIIVWQIATVAIPIILQRI
jgi:hypothetical protein